MKEMFESGEAIDLSKNEIEPGVYAVKNFIEDSDYCDLEKELWIWSIGKNKETGQILASTDARFYLNSDFECLWLR
jgi:hypothetical protein